IEPLDVGQFVACLEDTSASVVLRDVSDANARTPRRVIPGNRIWNVLELERTDFRDRHANPSLHLRQGVRAYASEFFGALARICRLPVSVYFGAANRPALVRQESENRIGVPPGDLYFGRLFPTPL